VTLAQRVAGIAAIAFITCCAHAFAQSPSPAAPSISPAPLATPFTFAGIAVGESTQQLVAQNGEPIDTPSIDGMRQYIYLAPSGNAVLFAGIERGNVVRARILTSPWSDAPGTTPAALGVTLGDDASAFASIPNDAFISKTPTPNGSVLAYRGPAGIQYDFTLDSGKVIMLSAGLPEDASNALPQSIEPALHGGTSLADAIVLIAESDFIGTRSEYFYLSAHACGSDSTGHWAPTKQTLLSEGGHHYDEVDVTCSSDKSNRAFFFNIDGFFGKQ
jgi:hypothetical protein